MENRRKSVTKQSHSLAESVIRLDGWDLIPTLIGFENLADQPQKPPSKSHLSANTNSFLLLKTLEIALQGEKKWGRERRRCGEHELYFVRLPKLSGTFGSICALLLRWCYWLKLRIFLLFSWLDVWTSGTRAISVWDIVRVKFLILSLWWSSRSGIGTSKKQRR